MKYVLLLAAIATGLYLWSTNHGHQASPQPAQYSARHLSADDLESMGCHVDKSLGKHSSIDVPLIGVIEGYSLKSEVGCKVNLVSQIQKSLSESDRESMWAGIRAANDIAAKKRNFDSALSEGDLGEYSEITTYTQNGSHKGFTYVVEANGLITNVTIISDEIMPDEKMEGILRSKL